MLARARRAADEAFLGVDADDSRMREASQRAARPVSKGGLPNAWFCVAAAEALPRELDGLVDLLTVTLPWGSLLRGALGPEPWFSDAMRCLMRPDGELRMLLSVTPRDGIAETPALDGPRLAALAARYREVGWATLEAREATPEDVADSGSSWAKRLGIPGRRAGAMLRLAPISEGQDQVPMEAGRTSAQASSSAA